jgi:hypothetical protein
MQASSIGLLMLIGIAVVGSLISLLDHRSQLTAAEPPTKEDPAHSDSALP